MFFTDKATQIEKYAKKKNSTKLVSMLGDKNVDVRVQVINALGLIGDEAATNNLIALLGDPEPAIRAAVATSMGEMSNQTAKTHLQHLMERETDETVRLAVRDALGRIPNKK